MSDDKSGVGLERRTEGASQENQSADDVEQILKREHAQTKAIRQGQAHHTGAPYVSRAQWMSDDVKNPEG